MRASTMNCAMPILPGVSVANIDILVVDDDPDVRVAVTEFLSDAGYKVTTAVDGVDALAQLSKAGGIPGVILLDLAMPRMNGRELLDRLAKDPKLASIPVVVLSATTDGTGIRDDVKTLRKPVSGDLLLAQVRRCLRVAGDS